MGFATKEMTREEKQLVTRMGLRIAKLRAQQSLSRKELALRAELHVQYLYDVEMGKRNVTLYVLAKIARALQITLSTIIDNHNLEPIDSTSVGSLHASGGDS